jgi:hypothetical protein
MELDYSLITPELESLTTQLGNAGQEDTAAPMVLILMALDRLPEDVATQLLPMLATVATEAGISTEEV